MDLRGMAQDARRLGAGLGAKATSSVSASPLAGVLERHGLPDAPAASEWELSIGSLVAGAGRVNPVARQALDLLDRFGRVAVGPAFVGLDNEDIPWTAVTGLRAATVAQVLTESALDREMDRLRVVLPPVPGRRWVLGRVGDVVGSLLDWVLSDEGRLGAEIVTAVDHKKRLGRATTSTVGFFGVLLLTALPDVNRSIWSTAAARGATVPPARAPSSDAAPLRAEAGDRRAALERRLTGLFTEP
ncbi:hypothetical protein DQ239_18585 [Blastococcus sp. TF02-09]|uniref:hypothetical protein n=1 Tax=Blastococcus sp. TF02-09 TaxID=2250576 RepID=UPI000DE869D2|nr:hypothetical protein [Blastococcus sp. TF02-9]RBY74801.1 hypothetical protein DQ239_18585 [Blastococcus sp. TF02-9]